MNIAVAGTTEEPAEVRARFEELERSPRLGFPARSYQIDAPTGQGVYVIRTPRGRVDYVGRTTFGRGGLQQRLKNHLQEK